MNRTIVPTRQGPFFTGQPLGGTWAFFHPPLERLELGARVESALHCENGNIPAINEAEIWLRVHKANIGR